MSTISWYSLYTEYTNLAASSREHWLDKTLQSNYIQLQSNKLQWLCACMRQVAVQWANKLTEVVFKDSDDDDRSRDISHGQDNCKTSVNKRIRSMCWWGGTNSRNRIDTAIRTRLFVSSRWRNAYKTAARTSKLIIDCCSYENQWWAIAAEIIFCSLSISFPNTLRILPSG